MRMIGNFYRAYKRMPVDRYPSSRAGVAFIFLVRCGVTQIGTPVHQFKREL